MTRRAWFAVLAVAAAAPLAAADPEILLLWPDGSGHNHGDPAQHSGLGFGTVFFAHLSLDEAVGEVDVKTDAISGTTWAAVALLNGGFALIDGTDPHDPVLVAKARGGGFGADVKLSDDTNTVYLSLQGGGGLCSLADNDLVVAVPTRMQCGIQVWDATDKANPRFLWTLPTSSFGTHMIDYEVFQGVARLAGAAHGGPQAVPLILAPGDKVPVLVERAATGFSHDVTLAPDPLDATRLLAVVANWNEGVRVFDVTNPVDPELLGQWLPPAGSGGHIHTVMTWEVEGRRIIGAEQETFNQAVVSKVWFLDATDLGNIQTLGLWQNPDGKLSNSGAFRWSTHNFNVMNGKLYMGHYHGGLVVLEVDSLADLAGPAMLANYLPDQPKFGGGDAPLTWDAFPTANGRIVWVTDINTGLYVIEV